MFKKGTPESVGISSAAVQKFIATLDSYHLATHSILMARGDTIFAECYYAPFHKDFKHRMYSITKSFVAVAIGLLEEDGKLSLDDKFVKYFPEYENELWNDHLREVTIREMLTMTTSMSDNPYWFDHVKGTGDRAAGYFDRAADRVPGTIWKYDSYGSYMLGAIVEKLAGKPFLQFMQDRFLTAIGFNEDSYCLKSPGKYSWGDSAILCTPRDLLHFARFVMNYGTWDGKRYMNEAYLRTATSRLVDNSTAGFVGYGNYGYGYQIWQAPRGGFAFVGMGDQFAICDPKTNFIFVITSDNQGNGESRAILYHTLYKDIVELLGASLPEDPAAHAALEEFCAGQKLYVFPGETKNDFAACVTGKTFALTENPMGMDWVKFDFENDTGVFTYKNAQGEKKLRFGLGHNEFQKFPQEGYSDEVGGEVCPGHFYDCAVSAAWTEAKKLHIKVQIIDKYFGVLDIVVGFKDENRLALQMVKTAEDFLNEYQGIANGFAE